MHFYFIHWSQQSKQLNLVQVYPCTAISLHESCAGLSCLFAKWILATEFYTLVAIYKVLVFKNIADSAENTYPDGYLTSSRPVFYTELFYT